MAVTYKKLFHLLIDKGMTNAELMEKAGFSANIITRLKRNNYVSLDSIEKICKVLNCGVDDILEFLPDNTEEEEWIERESVKLKNSLILLYIEMRPLKLSFGMHVN